MPRNFSELKSGGTLPLRPPPIDARDYDNNNNATKSTRFPNIVLRHSPRGGTGKCSFVRLYTDVAVVARCWQPATEAETFVSWSSEMDLLNSIHRYSLNVDTLICCIKLFMHFIIVICVKTWMEEQQAMLGADLALLRAGFRSRA